MRVYGFNYLCRQSKKIAGQIWRHRLRQACFPERHKDQRPEFFLTASGNQRSRCCLLRVVKSSFGTGPPHNPD
jgi:hypothetical protein